MAATSKGRGQTAPVVVVAAALVVLVVAAVLVLAGVVWDECLVVSLVQVALQVLFDSCST